MRTISIIFVILFSGAYLHSADSSYIRPFKPAASDELIFNRMELIELNNGIRLTDFEYLIGDGSILTVSVEVVKDGLVVKDKSMSFTIGSKRSRFSKKGLGIFRVQGRTDQGIYLHHYHFDMDQGASYGVAFDAFVAQITDYEISKLFKPEEGVIFYGESSDVQSRIKISAKISLGTFDDTNPSLVRLHN